MEAGWCAEETAKKCEAGEDMVSVSKRVCEKQRLTREMFDSSRASPALELSKAIADANLTEKWARLEGEKRKHCFFCVSRSQLTRIIDRFSRYVLGESAMHIAAAGKRYIISKTMKLTHVVPAPKDLSPRRRNIPTL